MKLVHKSNVVSADLREHQKRLGMYEHKLIQSNATRWNSTHDMADRVVEQQAAIEAMYAADIHPTQPLYEKEKRLEPEDFDLLTDCSTTLRSFKEVGAHSRTFTHDHPHTHTHTPTHPHIVHTHEPFLVCCVPFRRHWACNGTGSVALSSSRACTS